MVTMTIDMCYYFKGSTNPTLVLLKEEDDSIHCISSYGERMMTVYSGKALGEFLVALANDEYA